MTDPNAKHPTDMVKPLPPTDEDEGENWRHAPVAPKDKGVIESLGASIPEVVTGSKAGPVERPKT